MHYTRITAPGQCQPSALVSFTKFYLPFLENVVIIQLVRFRTLLKKEGAYADGLLQKMDDFEERALRNMTDAQRNALLEGGFAWMKALRDAIDD